MWGFAALPPALAVAFMVGQAFGPYMPPPVQHWGRAARSLYCNSAAEGLWPEPCIGDATADQPGFNSAPDPPTSGGKGAASAPGADCVGRDAPADMSGIPRSMLYDWLQRGGGRVGPVKEHSFPGMDTRGIVATRNLTVRGRPCPRPPPRRATLSECRPRQAGDEMYRVPSALWLTETTAWNGATGQLFQRVNATREDVQGSCVIATQLLVERANPWSFWVPYVALLPDPIGVLFFDAEDTAALQSSVARGSLPARVVPTEGGMSLAGGSAPSPPQPCDNQPLHPSRRPGGGDAGVRTVVLRPQGAARRPRVAGAAA